MTGALFGKSSLFAKSLNPNRSPSPHAVAIKVDKMMVKAISVFDGQLSQRFVIYGRGADSNGGIIVHVDFETLHKRSCVGESRPGTEGSDYELWAPRSSVHSECILGHKDLYARRKPAARCFNKKTYEKLVQHHNCRCSALTP